MPKAAEETVVAPEVMRAERARILNVLLDRMESLAREGVDAIKREIPAYAALDERVLEDVRDQVERHYRANVASFLEDRQVTAHDISFVRAAATRRARSGFALEDYLNAYRVGQQFLWEAILAAAEPTPVGQAAAISLVTPVLRYADFASTHAARAYVEFAQYVVADADRERRDLLEHLLRGEQPGGGPLLSAAQRYGIGAATPMLVAVAVAVGEGVDTDVPHAASAAMARAGLRGTSTLVVVRQSEIVAVPTLPAGTDAAAICARLEEVRARLREEGMPLAMGISTVAAGVAELPRAYAEARTALDGVSDGGGVAPLPLLRPFDYLAMRADDTARRLVDPLIRAFLDEDRARGGALTETIVAFAGADLNLRVAAERLQVHANTAQYRLNRVEERTGRNPRRIADLVDLLVAISLDESGGVRDGRAG